MSKLSEQYWRSILTPEELDQIISYVMGFEERFNNAPGILDKYFVMQEIISEGFFKYDMVQEQRILKMHNNLYLLKNWKRLQKENEFYERKLYIFQYHEIHDNYTDEVRYYRISLLDNNEEDARKRAIEIFEKEYWKMKDDFEDPFILEFVIEHDYVKFLKPNYVGVTEWDG